jgi:hypothetical protein
MNVVLYAEDMEPITILDLSRGLLECLRQNGVLTLAVPTPVSFLPYSADGNIPAPNCKTVRVWCEKLRRNDVEHYMLFTADEEDALGLKSGILPGQRRDWQEQYERGFSDALVATLAKLMRGQ